MLALAHPRVPAEKLVSYETLHRDYAGDTQPSCMYVEETTKALSTAKVSPSPKRQWISVGSENKLCLHRANAQDALITSPPGFGGTSGDGDSFVPLLHAQGVKRPERAEALVPLGNELFPGHDSQPRERFGNELAQPPATRVYPKGRQVVIRKALIIRKKSIAVKSHLHFCTSHTLATTVMVYNRSQLSISTRG